LEEGTNKFFFNLKLKLSDFGQKEKKKKKKFENNGLLFKI